MAWHVWGGWNGDTGPYQIYAAPDGIARDDGKDWTAPRAGMVHLGTVDSSVALNAADSNADLFDGIAGFFPDDAKGMTGRGVAVNYGPA